MNVPQLGSILRFEFGSISSTYITSNSTTAVTGNVTTRVQSGRHRCGTTVDTTLLPMNPKIPQPPEDD